MSLGFLNWWGMLASVENINAYDIVDTRFRKDPTGFPNVYLELEVKKEGGYFIDFENKASPLNIYFTISLLEDEEGREQDYLSGEQDWAFTTGFDEDNEHDEGMWRMFQLAEKTPDYLSCFIGWNAYNASKWELESKWESKNDIAVELPPVWQEAILRNDFIWGEQRWPNTATSEGGYGFLAINEEIQNRILVEALRANAIETFEFIDYLPKKRKDKLASLLSCRQVESVLKDITFADGQDLVGKSMNKSGGMGKNSFKSFFISLASRLRDCFEGGKL